MDANIFFSKSDMSKKLWFKILRVIFFKAKIWRVVKTLFQNLTRCVFCLKNLTRCKFLISVFQIILSDFRWFNIKLLPTSNNTLLENDNGLEVKTHFTGVSYVFVSRLVLPFWLLRFLWQSGSWWVSWLYKLHYQLIYTKIFGVQKMVSLQSTSIVIMIIWKKYTIFIISNSNLSFSTCSILCAETGPLVRVDLVVWKELTKWFLYFLLKILYFATLGFLSTPLFRWLKWTALCTISKSCPVLTIILPLKRFLKSVYRQSTCW